VQQPKGGVRPAIHAAHLAVAAAVAGAMHQDVFQREACTSGCVLQDFCPVVAAPARAITPRCCFMASMRRPDCDSLPVTQLLLQRRGNLKLNSITTMYYVSPCCFVFLLLPWTFLEYPKLAAAAGTITFDPLVNDFRVLAGHY